jgi:hypothetical protein
LSEQQIRFADVGFGPSDDSGGVRWRFRTAMKQDWVAVRKFVPVRNADTTALRVVDDLDGNATRHEYKTAHNAVVPHAELG